MDCHFRKNLIIQCLIGHNYTGYVVVVVGLTYPGPIIIRVKGGNVLYEWAHIIRESRTSPPLTHTHIYSTTHTYSPHTISFHHQNIPYSKSVSGCRIDTGTLSTYKHLITNHQNYNTHITYVPNTKTSIPIPLFCSFIYLKNMVVDSCPPLPGIVIPFRIEPPDRIETINSSVGS